MSDEPLLTDSDNRYTLFPITCPDIWDMAKTHEKVMWFTHEIDLSKDRADFLKLSKDEQHFIKHVLAFFAASDGIVMENLAARFCNEIQNAEARAFYSVQMFMENVHSETYSLLIETFINSPEEKNRLFNAIETIPAIEKKAKWAQKWIDSGEDFATRLVAFAIVESVFFSGSFCAIYWIREKRVMPGLCASNEFIARDEGLHCQFAVLLYTRYVKNKMSFEKFSQMLKEALEIEKEFILDSLPCALLGMNSEQMSNYVEFVANRLARQLGYEDVFPNAIQPFEFMDNICVVSQTNFFEERENAYQKHVKTGVEDDNNELVFDAEF